MIDFSFIGKDGFIIQYEDIISLIGYNVSSFILEKLNKKTSEPDMDLLMRYFNRTDEDIFKFIKQETGIECGINDIVDSAGALRPNMLYAHKFLQTAYVQGIKNLTVFSNFKSDK